MWNLLRKLNDRSLTILLTTHYIEEAQSLCGRVGMMQGGRLEEVDTPAGFIERLGPYALDETTSNGLKSRYFPTREAAMACVGETSGQFALRDTTLEDVFVERSGKRLQ